jgi:hypothetical protein
MESGNLGAYPLSSLYERKGPPVRSLGLAIVVAAITDYRGSDKEARRDAASFLYPETEEAWQHYDWAVAMQHEVNAEWLREALDQARPKWKEERKAAARALRRKANEKRVRLDGRKLHDQHTGTACTATKPAYAPGAAGTNEAAPCL